MIMPMTANSLLSKCKTVKFGHSQTSFELLRAGSKRHLCSTLLDILSSHSNRTVDINSAKEFPALCRSNPSKIGRVNCKKVQADTRGGKNGRGLGGKRKHICDSVCNRLQVTAKGN